jgi:creatinine amidohydrolase
MQHVAPDLVLPLDEAGRGRARIFRIQALREGWAWAPRDWKKVTDDTGVGDPKAASAAKGERFFHDVTQKVAGFLTELAAADLDDMYRDP